MSNIPIGSDNDPRAPWNQPIRPAEFNGDYDNWFEDEWEKELDRWYEEAEMKADAEKDETKPKTR